MAAHTPSIHNAIAPADSVCAKLAGTCAAEWEAYVAHDFVRQLGEGRLPQPCFRRYLIQDYLFLRHFSRAYALAVYKSDDLDDMRQSAATLTALLETEMALHVTYCAGWGISEADLADVEEAPQTLAYTRFVLETGVAGDLLDLLVALAPCVVGYAEIGKRLEAATKSNYRTWIAMYAGDEYQAIARSAVEQLDRVAARRLGSALMESPRWPDLINTFRVATRLEADFWTMGLQASAQDSNHWREDAAG